MAENLGQAQLTLTVDLSQFSKDLQAAKRLVSSELGDVSVGARRGQQSTTGQRNTEVAAERRERAQRRREERAAAAQRKKEVQEINNAARNGGRRENVRALEIAQEKRFRIARRIDALEERGADVARLRTRLGQLTETQSNRQFGSFRRISTELARQVTLEERKTQIRRRAEREARQQATLGARQGGASEPINALEQAQNRRFRLSQRINKLEESGVKVTNLRSKLGDLTTSYAQRQFGTAKQLSNELTRQVALTEARARREREIQQQLDKRARAGGARSPIGGSKDIPGSPAFLLEQRRREQQALDRAARLGGARSSISGSKDIPGSPAFLLEQRRREQQSLDRAARLGGPREPIRGRKDLPGSPAFLEAQVKRSSQIYEEFLRKQAAELRRSAQAGGPRSPVSGVLPGGVRIPGSPADRARQLDIANNWKVFLDDLVDNRKRIDKSSAEASAKLKGPALPVSGRLINGQVVPGSPADRQRTTPVSGGGATPRGASLPISGRLVDGSAVPGSPAALADAEKRLGAARKLVERETRSAAKAEETARKTRNKRFGEAAGNAVIGGAFPALFGQGVGASVGGAVGGAAGGLLGGNFGFGLSLVGTAVGQAFDTALQKGQDLAKGLDDPINNFQLLADAALFSSKAVERNVASLIAAGREEEAAIAARRDLNQRFGGAENARAFTQATDELNRAWTEATVSLTAFVAGPLADFLSSLATGLGGSPGQGQAQRDNARANELINSDPKLRQQFIDLAKQRGLTLDGDLKVGAGDLGKRVELVKEFLRLQGELTGAQRDQVALDAASADAAQRRQKIEELTSQIIKDQASGNRTGELEKTRRKLELQRTAQLNTLPTNATQTDKDAVNINFANELLKVDTQRLELQRQLNETITQEGLKRQEIAKSIEVAVARQEAALAAADAGANPGNAVLAARSGAAEGAAFLAQNRLQVEQAITRERQLQAEYLSATDDTKRSQIAEQLTTAAAEVRAAGADAGAALAERAATAAQSLRSAQDSLRSTLQSNFRLLPREQRQGLLDSARADIARGRETGLIRNTIRPVGRQRTFEVADFVRNVEQQRAQVANQQALIDALNTNSTAERNIRINVTMNGDGSFNVNQTEQQAALL